MGRPKNPVPTYRRHVPSDTARCWIGGKWVTLGRWNSPESKLAFERVCAGIRVPGGGAVTSRSAGPTIQGITLVFARFAAGHYRDEDGRPTAEIGHFKLSLAPLITRYGESPAAAFGPLMLKTVRQDMIDAGLSRGVVNHRVARIRRMFKWAASEELVPAAVFHGLATVTGLKKGRTEARETEPVPPAPDADVNATAAVLPPTLAAMVRLQRLAGMRPAEVCRLTPGQIDRTNKVWSYQPKKHKGLWRGKSRVVRFGPRAQKLLRAVVKWGEPDLPVFRPAAAKEERYAALRAARKSKVPPSQADRAKPTDDRKRPTPPAFVPVAYAQAVARACVRAGVPHWHPNQLRHSYATEVRKRFGLEAAGAGLGHSKMSATEVYAERDSELAVKVAAEMG